MKIINILLLINFFTNTFSFFPKKINNLQNINFVKRNIVRIQHDSKDKDRPSELISYFRPQIMRDKIHGLISIIRPGNILPTLFLSIFGGWIVHPNVSLFCLPKFLITITDIILIMSSSMIINDIYDIDIDKKNNPSRPLTRGVISVKESLLFCISLIFGAEYLSYRFLSGNLQFIINVSIINLSVTGKGGNIKIDNIGNTGLGTDVMNFNKSFDTYSFNSH